MKESKDTLRILKMIEVYFNLKIYSIADNLINLANKKLIHSDAPPKHYAIIDLGIVTLLNPGERYLMHDDGLNNINIVTFLNHNGGMKFETLDVKAFKGLSMKFSTSILHQPYTNSKPRWALLQRQ